MTTIQPLRPDEEILEPEGKERIKALVDASLDDTIIKGKIQSLLTAPGNLIDVFDGLEDALKQHVGPTELEKIKKEATKIIEDQLSRHIIGKHTGKTKEEIDKIEAKDLKKEVEKVIEDLRKEAIKANPALAFRTLEDIKAAGVLVADKDALLTQILVLKKTSRAAQENTPERFEKVIEQGGKYYWHTVPGKFEAWHEGYEGNALLGEMPMTKVKRKELSPADKTKYEAYKLNKEAERGEFYKILDDIAAIPIDKVRAASDTTGDYLKDEAHKFFNNLPPDKQKIFARFEGLLLNGSYDPESCIRRVLSYLNATFGVKGRFIETKEYLRKDEKERLLDTLDTAEEIVEELLKVMPAPAPNKYDFLKQLKKAISTCGDEERAIYLKYVNLRGISEGSRRIDDSTMLYFIDYMFQLRDNGITSNVKMPGNGDMGVRPAVGEWKVKDHPDEFDRDMAVYREFMAFIRGLYPSETPGKLRTKLKKMCEEYKKSGSEGEKLYKELSDKITGMKNFSDTMIAELYKALLLFEKTPINIKRREFNETSKGELETTPDMDESKMRRLRDDYAKRRRGLRAFFIKHTKDLELTRARTDYVNGYRQRIMHNVTADAVIKAMPLDTEDEKRDFRIALRKKVVSELLAERKKLFTRELEVHRVSHWQKLKTWFRQHPYIRLGVGAGATVGFIAAAALGAPAAAVPFILARMAMWQVGWEGGWEAAQNKLGATRNPRLFDKIKLMREPKKMDIKESREKLAAHTTLAIGTRPGFDNTTPPAMGALPDFYSGQTGADIWDKYTSHLHNTIGAALKALPADSSKEDIIGEAIRTGMQEEINFMKDVENRERHMRMTDALKKVTGLVSGFVLFGKDLFVKETPPEAIHQGPPRPTAVGETGVTPPEPVVPHAPPEPPVPLEPVVPPEPNIVPPEPHVVPPEPTVIPPHPIAPSDITFRMIGSMPGDTDPGIFQAMPFKLGLTSAETHQLHSYIIHSHTLSGMEQINPLLNRPGIIDSHGVLQQGANFVKGGEVFKIPDGSSFIDKIYEIVGHRIPRGEIIKRLAS